MPSSQVPPPAATGVHHPQGSKPPALWARVLGEEIPLSFKELIRRVWKEIQEDNLLGLAAQMSYFFVLSFFPFLIFLAALIGYLPFTDLWSKVLAWIAYSFPAESQRLIIDTVLSLTRKRTSLLSLGLLGTAWAASSGIITLSAALNVAYEVKETRSFWKLSLMALGMLFILSFFFITAFGLLATGDWLGHWIGSRIGPSAPFQVLWAFGRWVLSLVLMGIGIAIVYYALPNGGRLWRGVIPGTVFVVLVWLPVSLGFGMYVKHLGAYDKMYGSLGAFVILMIWVYVTSLILLVGAEINSELRKARRERLAKPLAY